MEKFIMLLGAINKMDSNRVGDLKSVLGWFAVYMLIAGLFICILTAIILVFH